MLAVLRAASRVLQQTQRAQAHGEYTEKAPKTSSSRAHTHMRPHTRIAPPAAAAEGLGMPRLHAFCAQDNRTVVRSHARPTCTQTDTQGHTQQVTHPSSSTPVIPVDSRHPSAGMLDAKLGNGQDSASQKLVCLSSCWPASSARQAELRDERCCRVSQTRARQGPWHTPA